jgi:hypothetical protein
VLLFKARLYHGETAKGGKTNAAYVVPVVEGEGIFTDKKITRSAAEIVLWYLDRATEQGQDISALRESMANAVFKHAARTIDKPFTDIE